MDIDPNLRDGIAVVGMAGRFPGAATVDELWRNLRAGQESIRFFSDTELAASGVDEAEWSRPDYVPAKGVLDDIAGFDAEYFGMSPREAALTDPQQRIFLEICVELLETAGVWPAADRDRIGVFGGVSKNTYLYFNLLSHPELRAGPAAQQTLVANEKDYLASRASYKLGLRGPSMSVQTACSTSLVATHLAGMSLLAGECDYAIAGGVAVDVPHHAGYVFEPGGILSPDGHCRVFDANARGTVFGQGAGAVLLRRLPDALADGDRVHAVIRGSAVNNDGAGKAGFTAPSVHGQAGAIVEALAMADIDPATVSYVEAHGTGTPIGDPIEIEALTRAYRLWTDRVGFCRIGSVKSNLGHLNSASGVTGLIKAVLALRHAEIPPSLHFERPNPQIPFAETPFRVCAELTAWPDTGHPRRAGVSSFGIGGTNAHVVLEEPPADQVARPVPPDGREHVVVVSAKTPSALRAATARLATALTDRPELALADVAHTQQTGRWAGPYRAAVVADTTAAAVDLLAAEPSWSARPAKPHPSVAFVFPGQGVQRLGLGQELHRDEPAFRQEFDRCADRLRALGATDPRDVLFRTGENGGESTRLNRTELVQPALFALEYALARLWMSWGIEPDAVLGHSLGEIVAATVAGVLDIDDALTLVVERARLVGASPTGAMLAVICAEDALPAGLPEELVVAAVNGPRLVVLSGPVDAIGEAAVRLREHGVATNRLATSHAFHSAMMEPAVSPLVRCAAAMTLRPPAVPCLSNVTGDWLTEEAAVDPAYWGRQLRQPVRFGDCLGHLLADPDRVLLEIGPGRVIGRMAQQNPLWTDGHLAVGSLPATTRDGAAAGPELAAVLDGLARLWSIGVGPNWRVLNDGHRTRPVELPTYPFERRRHWIDPVGRESAQKIAVPAVQAGEAEPPAEPAARVVADVFADLLGVPGVGQTDDFFQLGGHSLLGVELAARLHGALGVDLPLTAVLDEPTPVAIAALADQVAAGDSAAAVVARRTDSAGDVWFDAIPSGTGAPAAVPGAVLLTGATGFLGAFLLGELLHRTDAEVNVLVRADDPAAGRRRVLSGLRRYGLLDDLDTSRIRVEIGDLGADRLGLADATYGALAERVDAIYHNGAKVSFLEPYRQIRKINVDGTRAVLRLACDGRAKTVHHVSSIAVLDCDVFATMAVAAEDTDLSAGGGFHGGYDESKWVAERLVELARERGVPATIYRPGNIAGHSGTGVVSTGHLVSAMIKGCIRLGVAPDSDSYVDVVPVDYVSRALVHISLSDSAGGQNFHLVNPVATRWSDIVDGLRALGYPIRTVSLADWRTAIRSDPGPENPMRVFLPMLDERALFSGRRYRQDRTAAALAGSGIECPPLDTGLLAVYVDHLVTAGELPKPVRV